MDTMIYVFLLMLSSIVNGEYSQEFMTSMCGVWLNSRISGRIESSSSLTYDNNVNCETTISVSDGKLMILYIKRFEMEDPDDNGTCLDYLSIYDGLTSASPLLMDRKCGSENGEFSLNTTSNHVTLKFVTDGSAKFRGFEIEYTAFSHLPCIDGDFVCARNICVDVSAKCDDVTQCGDFSDEYSCDAEDLLAATSVVNLPLIIGCSAAGLVLLIVIIIAGYKIYYYLRWKDYHRKPNQFSVDHLYQYPVTDMYNRYDVGLVGRRQPRDVTYFVNPLSLTSTEIESHSKDIEVY